MMMSQTLNVRMVTEFVHFHSGDVQEKLEMKVCHSMVVCFH